MALNRYAMTAIIALAALSSAGAQADDTVLTVYQQNQISYVTGGIGKEESDALEATQSNYNLRIMNADKTGHFSGDTRIVISDAQHNAQLDAISGPLFYANLPKGRYIVESYSKEQIKKQIITISGKKPVYIRFVWPEDLGEISNQ